MTTSLHDSKQICFLQCNDLVVPLKIKYFRLLHSLLEKSDKTLILLTDSDIFRGQLISLLKLIQNGQERILRIDIQVEKNGLY